MQAKMIPVESALRVLTDRLSVASVERGIGLVPVDLGPGKATFRAPLVPGASVLDGRINALTLSVIVDTAVGVAVFTGQPRDSAGVTAELCIDHAGALGADSSWLDIVGEALTAGSGMGTGRAEVRDNTGVVVATAVGVVAVDPVGGTPPRLRSPLCLDPTAVRLIPLDPDCAKVEIHPEMLNRRGSVHGGVLMGLAHEAQYVFQLEHGFRGRQLQMGMDYLRPAPADGDLVLKSSAVRRGRRLWLVRTELLDARGRIVAIAHGTSYVSDSDWIASPEMDG